jgi:hypothetical protein
MDLTEIDQALDELYRQHPHLPRPEDLAAIVHDAWTGSPPTTPATPHGRTNAVIHATWPIGAALGAQRGHQVAATALRDMVGEGLAAGDVPNPEGVELLALCALVVDELPTQPDTSEVTDRIQGLWQWVGTGDDLQVALAVGFGNGWLAGHRDATDQLVECFETRVTNRVGADTLTTLFLNVELTGQDLVAGICAAAYLSCERDQTTPVPPDGRVLDRDRPAGRPFIGLHQIHPTTRNRPKSEPPPPANPGRPGPSR